MSNRKLIERLGIAGSPVPAWSVVTTPKLRLRPARIDDLPAMEMALADARFPLELPLAKMLRESRLSSWLQRMTSDPSEPRLWAITANEFDACIGTVALVEETMPKTWWLSYWLAPTEWRKGLASEAVDALLNRTAQHPRYELILAAVAQSNLPSLRLLERIGFAKTSCVAGAQLIPQDHLTMQRRLRVRGDALSG